MTCIDVFADIVCPFTHVGLRRLSEERHARACPVTVRVRAWPLELVNGAAIGPDVLTREIDALRAGVAPDLFAGFDASLFPLTSIPAFGLVAAAYSVDDATGAAVSMAVRDALFEHGLDISSGGVLRAIGRRFDVESVDLATARAATVVDWERGKARGVQGSPHFFIGDHGWFCPSLDISHHGDAFEVSVDDRSMHEFYEEAFT